MAPSKWFATMFIGMIWAFPGMASETPPLSVSAHPIGVSEQQADLLARMVLGRRDIMAKFKRRRFRVLRAEFDEAAPEKERSNASLYSYHLQIYDYTLDRLFDLHGDLSSDRFELTELPESYPPPPPTPEEVRMAIQTIARDGHFSGFVGQYDADLAMPGILKSDKERVIAVSLVSKSTAFRNEIVGVSLSRPRVIRYPEGAPTGARFASDAWLGGIGSSSLTEPKSSHAIPTWRGSPGQVRIDVRRGNEILWTFDVTRPSESSGNWGSGIDLRNVFYRGRFVLSQLHLPIVTVDYEGGQCGPFRAWQFSEQPFVADGADLVPGVRQVSAGSAAPKTLLETGSDDGTFRGVALQVGESIVLTTELQAGPHRMIPRIKLTEDGKIEAQIAFASAGDPCAEVPRRYNAYWRADLDIGGSLKPNRVEAYDGSHWVPVLKESKLTMQNVRVIDPSQAGGYELLGEAASGEVFALRYRQGEMEDTKVYSGPEATVSMLLNQSESLNDTDAVLWYHAQAASEKQWAGVTLRPVQ